MSAEWVCVADVRPGDIIEWVGRPCRVIDKRGPERPKWAHKVWYEFDVDVPEIGPRDGLRYERTEQVYRLFRRGFQGGVSRQ